MPIRYMTELTRRQRQLVAFIAQCHHDTGRAPTFQEIADLRGVPLPTATSWYRRGLAKLKALLAKEVL